jgi:hypothetical protein
MSRRGVVRGGCLNGYVAGLSDGGNWQRVAGPASRGAAGVRASGWALYGVMEPLLVGRALLGAGSLGGAVGELRRAAELAREVGATGMLALAAVALDQALILTGGCAAQPRPGRGRHRVAAIAAENDGLVALLDGRAIVAAAAFALAVERWQQLGSTTWLARALSLQAAATDHAGNPRRAGRLGSRADSLLDQIKTPARNRPGIRAPIPA